MLAAVVGPSQCRRLLHRLASSFTTGSSRPVSLPPLLRAASPAPPRPDKTATSITTR